MPLVLGPYHSSISSSKYSPDVPEILCLHVRNRNLSALWLHIQFGWRKLSILQWHSVYGALLFVCKALKPNRGLGGRQETPTSGSKGSSPCQRCWTGAVQGFACSEGAGRGTEGEDARAESKQENRGQQARVPSWAHQGVEQPRGKGRGIQGWSLSLAEEDRRTRKREVIGKGNSTCHLKGICANQF